MLHSRHKLGRSSSPKAKVKKARSTPGLEHSEVCDSNHSSIHNSTIEMEDTSLLATSSVDGLELAHLKGDDIFSMLESKSVPTRDRRSSFSRSISLKVRGEKKKPEMACSLGSSGIGEFPFDIAGSLGDENERQIELLLKRDDARKQLSRLKKEAQRLAKEEKRRELQILKEQKKKQQQLQQLQHKRKGFGAAFTVTKARSHSNLYTRTREYEDKHMFVREYLSDEDLENHAATPTSPPTTSSYNSSNEDSNRDSDDGELGGGGEGDDLMGMMEFMKKNPPRKGSISLCLAPYYLRNSSAMKSVQKEYKSKDFGLP